ncbi:MAG: hypothetical protein GXP41_11185 [Chloroflexi bacterium]|nr:hypothetical protein [Chloroflexota bacterium]
MDSGMIGKILKAKQYAEELDRIQFRSFDVEISGHHDSHHVNYQDGQWRCDCGYFVGRGVCSHTMAMERVLGVMIPAALQPA